MTILNTATVVYSAAKVSLSEAETKMGQYPADTESQGMAVGHTQRDEGHVFRGTFPDNKVAIPVEYSIGLRPMGLYQYCILRPAAAPVGVAYESPSLRREEQKVKMTPGSKDVNRTDSSTYVPAVNNANRGM